MTTLAWIFAAIAAVAAVANWVSRADDHRPTELWSKPLALIGLIGVAVSLDPADPTVRAWFVVALICSLAGDVFLLDDRRFVFGLAAFLTRAPRVHRRFRRRARLAVVGCDRRGRRDGRTRRGDRSTHRRCRTP